VIFKANSRKGVSARVDINVTLEEHYYYYCRRTLEVKVSARREGREGGGPPSIREFVFEVSVNALQHAASMFGDAKESLPRCDKH
jgi:hypothetical protein